VQRGEVATKMYFIKSGLISVLATDNRTIIAFMSEGTYFGEIGILLTQKRSCSIQARSLCVFFTIEKDDLMDVLN
jgi:CRP-like cAMP-binding protein